MHNRSLSDTQTCPFWPLLSNLTCSKWPLSSFLFFPFYFFTDLFCSLARLFSCSWRLSTPSLPRSSRTMWSRWSISATTTGPRRPWAAGRSSSRLWRTPGPRTLWWTATMGLLAQSLQRVRWRVRVAPSLPAGGTAIITTHAERLLQSWPFSLVKLWLHFLFVRSTFFGIYRKPKRIFSLISCIDLVNHSY